MDKLKPCPFCGCKNINVEKIGNTEGFYLTCPECEIEQPIYSTLNEAIEAWNRRAEPWRGEKYDEMGG